MGASRSKGSGPRCRRRRPCRRRSRRRCPPAGRAAHDLVELHLVHLRLEAVEHDELRALHLVIAELAHVGVVGEEGARVREHELLRHEPVLRQRAVERVEHPHAVVLDHDALRARGLEPGREVLRRELALLLHGLELHAVAGKLLGLVFLYALLADQQQRRLAVVEALVLKRLLYEFRLSGLEKAGEKVNGYLSLLSQV